ncbi:hypothetical protein PGTUg99_008391 [Puccinia graminis f. sp. tritici]|uniref:Uncharacterized protein n=1 Tax=Puccinia graminis f. sp. tritici TaxID=56615 RepID=A0A5B0RWU9_PUCGR|nr:hypothetical protein PGTUg99_008391 [Puccinia graminis f. sp. tritici]
MRRAVVWVKYQSSRPLNTAPRPQRLAIGHWARKLTDTVGCTVKRRAELQAVDRHGHQLVIPVPQLKLVKSGMLNNAFSDKCELGHFQEVLVIEFL